MANLIALVPSVGRGLPSASGKNFGLKANIRNGNPIKLSMDIVPFMELFNASDVFILSVSEDISDQYFAVQKVSSITKALYDSYDVDQKEYIEQFDSMEFFRNSLLIRLIYPLDGFKTSKKIYFPGAGGPKWCWPAFIIPEFWFIWHEIWGAGQLMIMLEFLTVLIMIPYKLNSKTVFLIFLAYRIIAGFVGNRIFYLRYGRWPKEKNKKISKKSLGKDASQPKRL